MKEKIENKRRFPETEIVDDRIDVCSSCESCDCESQDRAAGDDVPERDVLSRIRHFFASSLQIFGIVDRGFGLDDMLTKKHLWDVVIVSAILLCSSLLADAVIGELFLMTGTVFAFVVGVIGVHGLGLMAKRNREKIADSLNGVSLSGDSTIEDLRVELRTNGMDYVNAGVLEVIEDNEEVTWRDIR